MRIIAIIAMLITSMIAGHSATAKGLWGPGSGSVKKNCETNSGSRGKEDCEMTNHCIESAKSACRTVLGDTTEEQGLSYLAPKCFDAKKRECAAEIGVWLPPAQANCGTISGSSDKKDCKRINYCKISSAEACLAHVSDTEEDQGGVELLHGCFEKKMGQCAGAARDHGSDLTTNLTNAPDAWDCITNPGKATQGKASPTRCRQTNFCLNRASTTCSEQIGSAKYTDEGRGLMFRCVHPKAAKCMRALN